MKKYLVNVNGTDYEICVEALKDGEDFAPKAEANKPEAPKAAAPQGGNAINAPMPGTILDVKVAKGQSVKAGDTLVILEAMKMENEIQAPADGKVASVLVSKGSTVASGDALVVLE